MGALPPFASPGGWNSNVVSMYDHLYLVAKFQVWKSRGVPAYEQHLRVPTFMICIGWGARVSPEVEPGWFSFLMVTLLSVLILAWYVLGSNAPGEHRLWWAVSSRGPLTTWEEGIGTSLEIPSHWRL